jgi:hypothetical protein
MSHKEAMSLHMIRGRGKVVEAIQLLQFEFGKTALLTLRGLGSIHAYNGDIVEVSLKGHVVTRGLGSVLEDCADYELLWYRCAHDSSWEPEDPSPGRISVAEYLLDLVTPLGDVSQHPCV